MKKSFDYFPRIACINLISRTDRWELVKREFRKLGILDRVEHFRVTRDEIPAYGTAHSHIQIIKQAKIDNLSSVFIFEDDARILHPDKILFAIEELKQLPWDLFFLGSSMSRPCELTYASPNLVKVTSGGFPGSHAYAVRSSMYDAILDHPWKFDWELTTVNKNRKWARQFPVRSADRTRFLIDLFYCKVLIPSCDCYHINPIQCIQANGRSDLTGRIVNMGLKQTKHFKTKSKSILGIPK